MSNLGDKLGDMKDKAQNKFSSDENTTKNHSDHGNNLDAEYESNQMGYTSEQQISGNNRDVNGAIDQNLQNNHNTAQTSDVDLFDLDTSTNIDDGLEGNERRSPRETRL